MYRFKMEFDATDKDYAPEFTDEDFEVIMQTVVERVKANGMRGCTGCIMSPAGVRVGVWQFYKEDKDD